MSPPRPAGLLAAGARHGLTALLLQPDPPAGAAAAGLPWVHLNAAGTVTATNTGRIPAGTGLYRLNEQQTGELLALTARAQANTPTTPGPEASTTGSDPGPPDRPLPCPEARAAAGPANREPEPQPETPAEDSVAGNAQITHLVGDTNPGPVAGEPRERPDQPPATPAVRPTEPGGTTESGSAARECGIVPSAGTRVGLRVFGPVEVHVDGHAVSTGLRSKARELLALLAAHARRNPNAQDAPRDGGGERAALSGAAALYRGEFAHGAGYDWAETIRQELRARTGDALVRLADLHAAAGDTPGRLEALNQAVNTDPDEEALYQALMRAHAEAGDLTGVRAAYRKLQTRLDDLGVDPDPSTETLLTQLLGLTHPRRPATAQRAPFPLADGFRPVHRGR